MPGQIGWFIEDYVIYIKSGHSVTDEEFLKLASLSNESITINSEHPVHILIDNTSLKKQPSLQTQARATPNTSTVGWIIVIGQQNPVLRFGSSIAAQVAKINIRFVDSMSEAIETLKRVDQNLTIQQPIDWNQIHMRMISYEDMLTGKKFWEIPPK